MKLLFGFLLFFFSLNLQGQQIGVSELMLMLNKNENENEYYLNSKGYTLERLDTKETYTTTWYAYGKNVNNTAKVWVALSVFANGEKAVLTDFSDIKHFTTQKKSAEKLGFKFTQTKKESATMRFQEYTKGKLVLRFWTFIDNSVPDYEIALSENE